MRIRLSIPDHLVTPAALDAALDAVAEANRESIERGEVPALTDAIRDGVRWKPEPEGGEEHFDLARQVVPRGWGDCDDLAPWLAGELRATGDDPGARPRVYQTGHKRWHAVVETSDGEILDPSRWAGMGKRGASVSGAVARPFAEPGAGALCVMPGADGAWWSRCDVPWPETSAHLASHARARTPNRALARAVEGAALCGECLGIPDRAERVAAMLLDSPRVGGDPLGFARWVEKNRKALESGEISQEEAKAVGKQFGMGKGINLGKLAKGLLSTGLSMLPGGGLASSALDLLSSGKGPAGAVGPGGTSVLPAYMPSGGGPGSGGPVMLYYHPNGAPGPVIARF